MGKVTCVESHIWEVTRCESELGIRILDHGLRSPESSAAPNGKIFASWRKERKMSLGWDFFFTCTFLFSLLAFHSDFLLLLLFREECSYSHRYPKSIVICSPTWCSGLNHQKVSLIQKYLRFLKKEKIIFTLQEPFFILPSREYHG